MPLVLEEEFVLILINDLKQIIDNTIQKYNIKQQKISFETPELQFQEFNNINNILSKLK